MPSSAQKLSTILSDITRSPVLLASLTNDLVELSERHESEVAHIESAIELTDTQKSILESTVQVSKYDYQINPSLIGGLKVYISDQTYNLSIQSLLTHLQSQI